MPTVDQQMRHIVILDRGLHSLSASYLFVKANNYSYSHFDQSDFTLDCRRWGCMDTFLQTLLVCNIFRCLLYVTYCLI